MICASVCAYAREALRERQRLNARRVSTRAKRANHVTGMGDPAFLNLKFVDRNGRRWRRGSHSPSWSIRSGIWDARCAARGSGRCAGGAALTLRSAPRWSCRGRERAEEPFDHVQQPGAARGREVQDSAGASASHRLIRGRLVRARIVEDEMNVEVWRHRIVDPVEELPETPPRGAGDSTRPRRRRTACSARQRATSPHGGHSHAWCRSTCPWPERQHRLRAI